MAQQIFRTSPCPLFLAIFQGGLSLVVTVGLYVLVNRLGRKVGREHVKNGYGMLFGVVGIMVPVMVLWIASFKLGNLLINSALLMLLQPAILCVVVPVSKKCLGDNDLKLWSVAYPATYWVLSSASAF